MINIIINGWTFHNVSIYYQRDLKKAFEMHNYDGRKKRSPLWIPWEYK